MLKTFGILPALLLMAAPAFADINVNGSGSISAKPDLAYVNVGIETKDVNAANALTENNEKMNTVFGVLLGPKFGLKKEHLQTSQFNIQPSWSYKNNTRVFEGYVVTNRLTVKVCELEQIGSIINAVVETGGNAVRINGVNFTIENREKLEVEARKKAVEDALAKAKQLAETAGATVGNLKSISENVNRRPTLEMSYSRAMRADSGGGPAPISGGELNVQVNVNAVFTIIH